MAMGSQRAHFLALEVPVQLPDRQACVRVGYSPLYVGEMSPN